MVAATKGRTVMRLWLLGLLYTLGAYVVLNVLLLAGLAFMRANGLWYLVPLQNPQVDAISRWYERSDVRMLGVEVLLAVASLLYGRRRVSTKMRAVGGRWPGL